MKMLALFLIAWMTAVPARAETAQPNAGQLISGMEKLMWGKTYHGRFTMRIETEYWSRELALEVWMDRPKKTLIRIHAPRKERGTGSLRIGDQMWNYLPKVERTIKIPPSMMLQPWMGSNFSNDDLVKESSYTNDYSHRIIAIDSVGGKTLYTIESVPKPGAAVVWSRLVFRIRGDFIPVSLAYYGERDRLIKRMVYDQVRSLDGHRLPSHWVMVDAGKPKDRTVVTLHSLQFDKPMEAATFSLQRLRNPR